MRLLYRGSRDGFEANDFHKKCDNQGKTICLIKASNGKVFGGYADMSWKSSGASQ